LDPAGVGVAQEHVGFAGHAAEIAEPHDLPIKPDIAQEGGVGDVVIADVVHLEAAGGGAAQQHVGGDGAGGAAERDEGTIGSNLAQRVARYHCVVAEVVDFVLAGHGGGGVRSAQDQVGGRAGGRRVRRGDFKEALSDAADVVESHNLARVVDAVST